MRLSSLVLAAGLAAAACSGGAAPSTTEAAPPRASAPPPTPTPADATDGPAASGAAGPHPCKLAAPVKSSDACESDAQCGPDSPCHAHACVALSKAHPPNADIMCTQMMDCASLDVGRCGCLEGACALLPR